MAVWRVVGQFDVHHQAGEKEVAAQLAIDQQCILASPSESCGFGELSFRPGCRVDAASKPDVGHVPRHEPPDGFEMAVDDVVVVRSWPGISGDADGRFDRIVPLIAWIGIRHHDDALGPRHDAVGVAVGVDPVGKVLHAGGISVVDPPHQIAKARRVNGRRDAEPDEPQIERQFAQRRKPIGGIGRLRRVRRTPRHRLLTLKGEIRQTNDLASLFRGLMGAESDAGPVGAGHRVGPGVAIFLQCTDHFVNQVWM